MELLIKLLWLKHFFAYNVTTAATAKLRLHHVPDKTQITQKLVDFSRPRRENLDFGVIKHLFKLQLSLYELSTWIHNFNAGSFCGKFHP